MDIIDYSQATETQAWLNARRGRITGTVSKALSLKHYKLKDTDKLKEYIRKNTELAKTAKTQAKAAEYLDKADKYGEELKQAELDNQRLNIPADFWKYLAECWALDSYPENPMERGHRLENKNAEIVLNKLDIDTDTANFDPGMWVSERDSRLACSPDVHENSMTPTWAIECKSLGTPKHLEYTLPIIMHRELQTEMPLTSKLELKQALLRAMPGVLDMTLRDFDFVPDDYRGQVLQYFVVNPDLKTLYFTFYDDRLEGKLQHVFLTINRNTIEKDIEDHLMGELHTLDLVDIFDMATRE